MLCNWITLFLMYYFDLGLCWEALFWAFCRNWNYSRTDWRVQRRSKYSSNFNHSPQILWGALTVDHLDFLDLHSDFFVLAENWVILGVFYYPALYYPLLACGTLHNKVGYVLGSLLSWTHFGVLVWQKIDCPKTPLVSKNGFQYQ